MRKNKLAWKHESIRSAKEFRANGVRLRVQNFKNFKVIKKCRGKLECLIYEMLWIKNKRPKLNTQAEDKIRYLLTLENEITSKIVGKYTYLMFQKRKEILNSKYN